jgi:hypothetical protein
MKRLRGIGGWKRGWNWRRGRESNLANLLANARARMCEVFRRILEEPNNS